MAETCDHIWSGWARIGSVPDGKPVVQEQRRCNKNCGATETRPAS